MIHQISNVLVKASSTPHEAPTFYATHTLNPGDIQLSIEGIGPIQFPLQKDRIQALIEASSQAKFGLREKTVLDEKVRNTQEITADRITLTIDDAAKETLLLQIRTGLGLSKKTRLTMHLHNMLIYQPGQFFNTHQDSEKLENMVASVVMVLPSPHIGGDLVIQHNKEKHTFSSENVDHTHLQCIAFYADCPHKIKKVTHGHRIALTYNVVIEPEEIQLDTHHNAALNQILSAYFDQEEDYNAEPRKLVYFLDHDYTEHGLRWDTLKGNDSKNGLAFLSAAATLNLEPHLALVEIHQNWTSEDESGPNPRYDELIDSETTLSYWIDANNRKLTYKKYVVDGSEICWTTDVNEGDLVDSEYEGYQGNYGNTMDYWYRRTAIVLWQKSDQIAMGFLLNFKHALENVCALTHQPGQEAQVLEILQKAHRLLTKKQYANSQENNLAIYAQIATYIQDPDEAKSLLAHFWLHQVVPDTYTFLAILKKQYGVAWCLNLMSIWKENSKDTGRDSSLTLDISRLKNAAMDIALSRYLLDFQLQEIVNQDKTVMRQKPTHINSTLSTRIEKIFLLIQGCIVFDCQSLLDTISAHMIRSPELYPASHLVDIVITPSQKPAPYEAPWYTQLKKHVENSLQRELAKGLRDRNDYSIETKLCCSCAYCSMANAFLASKTELETLLAIAAQHRNHVSAEFRDMDLPVDLTVRNTGSPHKLVLTKSHRLHKNAAERFRQLQEAYAALKFEKKSL
jgi:predicted 2-oxoglutarate/Fe(II)-dependent dioxygenase YbiX